MPSGRSLPHVVPHAGPTVPAPTYAPPMPNPRTIPTAEALRALPYHSPTAGWHSHGQSLIPSDGCAACSELRRRESERTEPPPSHGG